jgi:hypothetical protein
MHGSITRYRHRGQSEQASCRLDLRAQATAPCQRGAGDFYDLQSHPGVDGAALVAGIDAGGRQEHPERIGMSLAFRESMEQRSAGSAAAGRVDQDE